MANQFVNQWVEMTQASFNTLKQMSESNIASFTALQKNLNSADTAELLKAYANSAQQLSEINTTALTTLFRSQMNFMNLGVSNEASQELMELSSNFIREFIQRQTRLSSEFGEIFTAYLMDLQKAKGVAEFKTLQIELFSKIEQKLQDHTKTNLEFLNDSKSATVAWSEKHLVVKS